MSHFDDGRACVLCHRPDGDLIPLTAELDDGTLLCQKCSTALLVLREVRSDWRAANHVWAMLRGPSMGQWSKELVRILSVRYAEVLAQWGEEEERSE